MVERIKTDTEGRRQLVAWLSGRKRAEFAGAMGVTQVALGFWLNGNTRPKQHVRERIRLLTGIEPDAWATEGELAFARGDGLPEKGAA